MKRLLILSVLLLAAFSSHSQTNVLYGYVKTFGLLVDTNVSMELDLLSPINRTWNGVAISNDPIYANESTNGYFSFTNVLWGKYKLRANDGSGTSWTVTIPANLTNAVPIASYIGNAALPPDPATNYYTQAQVDALISGSSGNYYTNSTDSAGVISSDGKSIGTNIPPQVVTTNSLSSDFTNSAGTISIAPALKIVPDGISLTITNTTLSTPASIPGGLVVLTNLDLTPYFTNAVAGTNIPVFSVTNRLIIGTVPSFYSAIISGFVPISPMNPSGTMNVEVSTDGGATWSGTGYNGVTFNQTVLVSIYDGGGGDDTATNLLIYGFERPTYAGITNDYRNQIFKVDDPSVGDPREAANVETASSVATQVRAYWSNDKAKSDVNLDLHDLIFGPVFREHVESGVWQLKANNLPLISVTPGSSAGTPPDIESIAINGTNLLFSVLTTESPKIQYKINLSDALWTDLPSQTSWYSNSLWWVSAPAPNDVTSTNAYFRAYIAGTNAVAAKVDFSTNAIVSGNFSGNYAGTFTADSRSVGMRYGYDYYQLSTAQNGIASAIGPSAYRIGYMLAATNANTLSFSVPFIPQTMWNGKTNRVVEVTFVSTNSEAKNLYTIWYDYVYDPTNKTWSNDTTKKLSPPVAFTTPPGTNVISLFITNTFPAIVGGINATNFACNSFLLGAYLAPGNPSQMDVLDFKLFTY